MKHTKALLTALVFAGSLAGSAIAAEDGILLKESLADVNYCHMRFPAIKEETLWGNNPQLKDSSSSDVIDFYGSCDETPTGPDQVAAQQLQYENRLDRDHD